MHRVTTCRSQKQIFYSYTGEESNVATLLIADCHCTYPQINALSLPLGAMLISRHQHAAAATAWTVQATEELIPRIGLRSSRHECPGKQLKLVS